MPKDIYSSNHNQDYNAGYIAGVNDASDRPCTISAWVTVFAILAVGMLAGWALTNYINVLGG